MGASPTDPVAALASDVSYARILVRLPTWVGDVVMATPALRALARRWPEAAIVCEGRPHLEELVLGLPGVREFLPDPGRRARDLPRRVRGLRSGQFELAVILPDSHRSALGPWLARIPQRVGYARDLGRRLMLSQWLPIPLENGRRQPASMIQQFLGLSRALGCPDDGETMQVPIGPETRSSVQARLAAVGIEAGQPYLVAVPGASYGSSKRWPAASFAAAAEGLHAQRGWPLVMAPGPGEEAIAHEVAGAMGTPVHVFAEPVLGLLQLAALIEGAALCLSNDTGPRHFAVALGVPVVVPVGPMDLRYTAHQLDRQRLVSAGASCSPCGLPTCPIDHHCMRDLTPRRILDAATELLAPPGESP